VAVAKAVSKKVVSFGAGWRANLRCALIEDCKLAIANRQLKSKPLQQLDDQLAILNGQFSIRNVSSRAPRSERA